MLSRLAVVRDLLAFFGGRRKFWLLPLVIALVVVAVLIVIAALSPVFTAIYPLF